MRKNQLEEGKRYWRLFWPFSSMGIRGRGELALIGEEDEWHDGEDGEGSNRVKLSV